jgi:hypothetical protein
LWSERFVIGLWPHGVTIRNAIDGRSSGAVQAYWQNPVDDESLPWQVSLSTLKHWITDIAPKRVRVDIVISDHFSHHLVLPWSQDLREDEEWLALAKARVDVTWGNGESWDVRIDRLRFGNSCLTCAMDRDLRTQLLTLERRPGVKVRSIQSNFTASFNDIAISVGTAATLIVVSERHSVTIGAVDAGIWRHIRTLSITGDDLSEIEKLVDRERLLLGLPPDAAMIYKLGTDASPSSMVN